MRRKGTYLFVLLSITLAACAPASGLENSVPIPTPASTATAPPAPVAQQPNPYLLPAYYDPAYADIVQASRSETQGVLVYSIIGSENWEPVIQAFNAHFPWITVATLDLGTYQVFNRYYFEAASGIRTADVLVSASPDAWQTFSTNGELSAYTSQEDEHLPAWSKLGPGIYVASGDPLLLIYNKALVKNPPDSMGALADLVRNSPQTYANKIVTYDAEQNATGFTGNWFWTRAEAGRAWDDLAAIGLGQPIFKDTAADMVNAVLSGEALIGYFVSAIAVYPRTAQEPNLGWGYIHDGQPILVRAMGLTRKGSSPNSARLFLDFVLSQEGQLAIGAGGLTPYRPDIANVSPVHLEKIAQAVGAQNLIYFELDPDLLDQGKKDAFIARWRQAVGK